MCLNSIQRQTDKPSTLIEDGWKQFSGTSARPEFANFAFAGKREVPLDQWIKAEGGTISASYGGSYRASFHVYEENQAISTRRVYVRRVHTRGAEQSKSVIVAEEMYVPSNPNDWPPKSGLFDKLTTAANKKAGNA